MMRIWNGLALGACFAFVAGAWGAERPLAVDGSQSRLQVDVRSTAVKFTATVGSFLPEIRVDDASGLPTSVHLRFPFATINTADADRDRDMYHWEKVQTYPEVTFEMSRLQRQEDGSFIAEGFVRLHGVERETSFPLTIIRHGAHLTIHGQAFVDTRDFGLPVIRKYLMLKVDPHLTVRFHIEGSIGP